MAEVRLTGCTPEPLMSYLKALGVFRLIVEQADSNARLSWDGGVASIDSLFDRDGLIRFFVEEYRPSPIVGPWGARSGFYPGSSESAAREALDKIVAASNTTPRLARFAETIGAVRDLLKRHGFAEKVKDDDKLSLMRFCRNELPDDIIPWLDAVFILTDESRKFPPLLGTGGNEGSGSYVSTFGQVVVSLLVRRTSDAGVAASLFAEFAPIKGGLAVGHFNPGAIGGANSSQGFDGGGGVNAWDYLFAIEGCLVFAGAVARRLGVDTAGRAAYPFCVEPVAVGYATDSDKESAGTRAELWVPLWNSSVSLSELNQLFAEGRAQVGRRQARNAVELALALGMMGVGRGIDSFVRYAFVMRNGLSYFASPLGRVKVVPRPLSRLLSDPSLTGWLDRLRAACRDKEKTPARFQAALRRVDQRMFEFANRSEQRNDAPYLTEILRALGRAERTLAGGQAFCKEKYIRPLQGLHADWLEHADDKSAEFSLAAGLVGMDRRGDLPSFREFLEEVEVSRFVSWSPGRTLAQWSNQSVARNLIAIFRRRLVESFRSDVKPDMARGVASRFPCRLEGVVAFFKGETDDEKLTDLIWGLVAVDLSVSRTATSSPRRAHSEIPFEFALARLVSEDLGLTPKEIFEGDLRWKINFLEPTHTIKTSPEVFQKLATATSSSSRDAMKFAIQCLRADGLRPIGSRNDRDRAFRIPATRLSGLGAERLAAALLFPLAVPDLESVANAVLYPPERQE